MGSRNYRLEDLSDVQFEELCSKICIQILGEGFVNFAKGKDGGRDGKFQGKANEFPSKERPYEGKFIVQAKHTTSPIALCSDSKFNKILEEEIPNIEKLNANGELEHYFILTNRKLTGNQEPIIESKIKERCPRIKSVSTWGKERIHSFLDINHYLHEEFGFNKFRSPLNIQSEDLKNVIEGFRNQIPKEFNSNSSNKIPDFLYIKIEKKNIINNLSKEYYQYITEWSEKYFHHIINFLKNPRNQEYRRLYNETAYDFKGVIISRRSDYDKFDEILEEVFSNSYSKLKNQGVDKHLLKVFIHFMYFNCDIGKKGN